MNVNGTEAGYPVAGYETRKTERNATGRNFADAINKAATKKETNAFRPESSDEVMQAWDKALAETGVNPFPMNRISTALVLHVENGQQGLSQAKVLKNSLKSRVLRLGGVHHGGWWTPIFVFLDAADRMVLLSVPEK